MKYDYSKLKGRIVEICGTQAIFAEKMGLTKATISAKLNGKIQFKQSEICTAIQILNLTQEDVTSYFFKLESPIN